MADDALLSRPVKRYRVTFPTDGSGEYHEFSCPDHEAAIAQARGMALYYGGEVRSLEWITTTTVDTVNERLL
jgi:hypothetical protein